jgi:hypothetical protein
MWMPVWAVLHQYRPVAANEGGLAGKVDISLEMGPTGDLWETQAAIAVQQERPHKPVSACRDFHSLSVPGRNRTCDLLLRRQ